MAEIWKNIKGYKNFYQISNFGKVKSLKRQRTGKNGSKVSVKKRILKSGKSKSGYLQVVLCKKGICKNFSIHRLIAIAFINNPTNHPEINHIDGNKTNNKIENLEWCTRSYNCLHSYKLNLVKIIKGENHKNSKLNEIQVKIIRSLKDDLTQKEIAKYFNISQTNIKDILNRRTWKHI